MSGRHSRITAICHFRCVACILAWTVPGSGGALLPGAAVGARLSCRRSARVVVVDAVVVVLVVMAVCVAAVGAVALVVEVVHVVAVAAVVVVLVHVVV